MGKDAAKETEGETGEIREPRESDELEASDE